MHWRTLPALAPIIALCIATAAVLWADVLTRMSEHATAATDSVQWTLSQVELEYAHLRTAIAEARADPGEGRLAGLRQRFDIFYSRIRTIADGVTYRPLLADGGYASALAEIERFLAEGILLIDGPDPALAASLGDLANRIEAIRPAIRSMPLVGVRLMTDEAEASRQAIVAMLWRVAALTLILLGALLFVVASLIRSNRAVARRAAEIAQTSARLETIVETSLDAIVVIGADGHIQDYNSAAETIFGYPREEALGRSMARLMIPEEMREAHAAGMLRYLAGAQGRVVGRGRVRLEALKADGSRFPAEVAIAEARGWDGPIFVSYLRDISDRLAAERDLRDARDRARAGEKAKSQFLAVMSHEMRTPLNGLLGMMQLMSDTRLTRRQKGLLETMRRSGELLLDLVNDVLDLSRFDAGHVDLRDEPVDLSRILEEVIESQTILAEQGRTRLSLRLDPALPATIRGDGRRLRQIMLNLVGNAVKFTREGAVTVEAERVPAPDGGEILELRVADTGIGIPAGKIGSIFDDFVSGDAGYARAVGGTGLGLAIVRRLVTAMGGTVGVESEEGEGSLFWVRLPLGAAPLAETPPPRIEAGETGATPHRRILIVEDNPVNRMLLRELLEADGHSVGEAEDGAQGVDMATRESWDLILMDISMPRMDGMTAAGLIRASGGLAARAPIIAITAHALPEEIATFRAAGMTTTLSKPVMRGPLRQAILEATVPGPALDRRPPRQGSAASAPPRA